VRASSGRPQTRQGTGPGERTHEIPPKQEGPGSLLQLLPVILFHATRPDWLSFSRRTGVYPR
jgi:hypothetical protein